MTIIMNKKGMIILSRFVRWTEKRNFEAVLNSISKGQLDVKSLITERIELENYDRIYNNISSSQSIASVIIYPDNTKLESNY